MCFEPTTLAALSLAASAGGAALQYMQADNAADAQEAQNRQMQEIWKQEEALAQMDLERQRRQEYEAAAAEANAYSMEARKQMAAAEALIGEGGAGNTGNRRLSTLGSQAGQDMATLRDNATKVQQELGFASAAASNSSRQKMASLRAPDRPSLLGTALTIGAAGIQYGNRMNEIKNPKPSVKERD